MQIIIETKKYISADAWSSMKHVALKAAYFFEEEFGMHISTLMTGPIYIGFTSKSEELFPIVKFPDFSVSNINLNAKEHVFAIVLMMAMLELEPGSIYSNLMNRSTKEYQVALDFFEAQILPWMS